MTNRGIKWRDKQTSRCLASPRVTSRRLALPYVTSRHVAGSIAALARRLLRHCSRPMLFELRYSQTGNRKLQRLLPVEKASQNQVNEVLSRSAFLEFSASRSEVSDLEKASSSLHGFVRTCDKRDLDIQVLRRQCSSVGAASFCGEAQSTVVAKDRELLEREAICELGLKTMDALGRVGLLGVTCAVLVLVQLQLCYANEYDHRYAKGDPVVLWVNKVGPYNNPQETYNYYSLPFCSPGKGSNARHKWGGLGEVLEGNELIDSEIDIKFRTPVEKITICSFDLNEMSAAAFKDAVSNIYWFEFFMDDLPLWGFVGEQHSDKEDDSKFTMFTHKDLVIKYNNDQIIQVNLTQDNLQPITPGKKVDLTFTVQWEPTNTSYIRRFDAYLDYPFFEHQIHWFSIFNSFMMVIFLTGLVSMILMRTLRNDYAKYARDEDDLETLERDVSEESGWKLVHGDVFRAPRQLVLLSALIGTGAQLAMLVLLVILLSIVGMLYVGRGAIVTAFIVCYALTSFIAGYVSGGFYSRNDGKYWMKSMLMTATLFPFLCFGIGFLLNFVAIYYGSLAAIPFGTMVVMLVIWAFISFPLALLGTVVGRNWSGQPDNPCRVKTIPRPIPDKKWYLKPSVVALLGGLLPFGSIFIEMYFVFTSFWQYKVYYVYGFMLLVFIILTIVTVCVTIVATYFLLNAENYHWQWTSFWSGSSTALYVYLYSIYYYYMKTKMSGFFQISFYFGYTLMFCLGLGIFCGAVGYLGSSLFVRRIYRNIKCD